MEINLTTSYVGILSLIPFIIAYAVVMVEEFSHLRKSKPVILSAAIIWAIIAFHFSSNKDYAIEINFALPLPQAINTEHMTSAVVKLSAIGERKKVIIPVKIKSCRKLKPLEVN